MPAGDHNTGEDGASEDAQLEDSKPAAPKAAKAAKAPLKAAKAPAAPKAPAEGAKPAKAVKPAQAPANVLPDRPEIRGMIARVPHLISISEEQTA
jgi:hypothetical protein